MAVAGILVSGCMGGQTPQGASSSASTSAAVPQANETAGALAGRILDDEGLPIASADVALLKTNHATRTDERGAYTLNGITPGKYAAAFSALGFDSASRSIEIRSGVVTYANVTLSPLAIPVNYTLTVPKTGYVNIGNVFFQDATWIVNNSNLNAVVCEACMFPFHIPKGPAAGLTETLWVSGQTGVPLVNTDVWLFVKRDWTTGEFGDGTAIVGTYMSDREAAVWGADHIKAMTKTDKLLVVFHGGTGVTFQLKVTAYNSLSYGGPFADDFTGLPPE